MMQEVETPATTGTTLVDVKGLKVHFPIRGGLLGRTVANVKAVDGVDLFVRRGETLGLVEESGCGKSTTGRAILQLIKPTAGSVKLDGAELTTLSSGEIRKKREQMTMIFQDPYGSLDPRYTVGQIVAEPLEAFKRGNKKEIEEQVADLLQVVGLNPFFVNRFSHEFSGGQRQRIGIARALALRPSFVVADEPVSALDVSIQAQVLNLLKDLQGKFGLTYLFVAHNLSVVKHISDRVAVMYLGRVVELRRVKLCMSCHYIPTLRHSYRPFLCPILRLSPGASVSFSKVMCPVLSTHRVDATSIHAAGRLRRSAAR